MPSSSVQQIELHFRFASILHQITEILDNLLHIQLELEDGNMPVFPPEAVFDPMKTIELHFRRSSPIIFAAKYQTSFPKND